MLPCRFGRHARPRPARRILIRRRGRVLRISPQTGIGPPGCGPLRERVWHLCRSSSRGARSRSRSALGLRPRRGALRLLRSSLRSPNLIAFGDRRILPSLRSALTSFGGYPVPRLGAPGALTARRGAILRRPDTASSSCAVPRRPIAEPRLAVSLRSTLETSSALPQYEWLSLRPRMNSN